MTFKPMLAAEADVAKLQYPMFASPKLDGIRASVVQGKLLTRTLKEVPNRTIYEMYSKPDFEGLDGELLVGEPTADDVYRTTVSGVMSRDGSPDFTYHVFDLHNVQAGYGDRLDRLIRAFEDCFGRIRVLPQTLVTHADDLLAYEAEHVNKGFEGVIVRNPTAPYKFGRSTAREGFLLKVKRFKDSEAVILDVIEEMHNANEAKTNALGRTERSSHKDNKVGKQRMGALLVRDCYSGVEFQIGTGFNDVDKQWFWLNDVRNKIVKYKYFPVGVKDKPRHPVYLGLRDRRDM